MKMAYLKSDKAGCYHNASLILSLKSIGERAGLCVQRYNFSDPQSGKDVCNRKIAPMKGQIQIKVNERHDVVTAVDMKEALESYVGVRGCRIAVAEVDVTKAAKPEEWKGISTLFNFEFLACGIRAWKAYGVGEGQMCPYDEVGRSLQGPTGLYIIMPLTSLTLLFYLSRRRLCGHISNPEGSPRPHGWVTCEGDGALDCFQLEWAKKVTGIQSTHVGQTGRTRASSHSIATREAPLQGWALKR